ncbi:hypothetical protein H2200_001383 [Cladophialophora chaetospira]|uniref:endo-1,3(4)-beta-glucanase n=1 Tax=Cladophialophora chaetospira TaxID=386627 RepID=A0AA39CMZ7_9EURO|nr:hypothetical protein H2200_001383 [Cladophialophora chaetospira]
MLAHYYFVTLVGLVSLCHAGYMLQDDYSSDQFFDMFTFFTDPDPTHGYVQYVDQGTAQSGGLISTNGGSVYIGVDHQNKASGSGRQSVRLTSKKSYTHGLIILDLAHMPGSICGTWPAFWTVGPNWPSAGEIDIIEGVNSQKANSMALHTGAGCSVSNTGMFSGRVSTPNCDVKASGQPGNAGCAILTGNDESYGDGFNQGSGGVYATEWTSDHISIWFFPRSAIPSDALSSNPNPENWGQPMASFAQGCDIDQYFNNHQIIFDNTFCGDWAGSVWTTDAVCSSKASTCQDFVQNNPSAFQDAYWSVNSLKVYQSDGSQAPSGSGAPSQSFPPQSPTASVPWSGPPSGAPSGAPSGGPPVNPTGPPTGPPPAQSSGFSWGGGRNSWKPSWGANFVASPSATAAPSASSDTDYDEAGSSATVGPPVVTSAAGGNANEYKANSYPAAPAVTSTPSSPSYDNDTEGDDDTTYSTVSAANYNDFWASRFSHDHKREVVSEPELAIEPRSSSDGPLSEGFRRHLSVHQRREDRHRHLFRRTFPEAESDE